MFKKIIGGIAALALIAILTLLIIDSRRVDATTYASHGSRLNQLERVEADMAAIVRGLRGAHNDARPVPESVTVAVARVTETTASLRADIGAGDIDPGIDASLAPYADVTDRFIADARTAIEHQDAMATALAGLQAESPAVVQDLRRYKLELQAQNAFTLTLDLMDYVTGKNTAGSASAYDRLVVLATDPMVDTTAPGVLHRFAVLADTVLTEYAAATAALNALDSRAAISASQQLAGTLVTAHRDVVRHAERARLLLSILSALLLAGVGIVGVRLQQSYSALNRSNQQLEIINNSLEERVVARTDELSSAYEDLQESQVQLVQAEKMSSLGSLVAGISHEINTPLWYLISNATVIQERLQSAKSLSDAASTMVAGVKDRTHAREAIRQGLQTMHGLIKDGIDEDIDEANDLIEDSIQGLNDLTEMAQSLKDFSRLDRAPVGQFDVNDGLEKTLRILKNKIKERVTVTKELGELPPITCSPSQVNQIFLNLISNAADAIEDSGEIKLRTDHSDGRVNIVISDTGCGIADELLAKIRDPFFTTKEVGKGTGLGLSIVEKIIKSHDGELSIDSVVGEGSVFTVSLPVTPGHDTAAEEATGEDDDAAVAVDPTATLPLGIAVDAAPVPA